MSQRASANKVEDVLLCDRLEDLGQIQPDFYPLEWTKGTKSEQGYSSKGIQEMHLRILSLMSPSKQKFSKVLKKHYRLLS